MTKRYKLEDYTKSREVIGKPQFCYGKEANRRSESFYMRIPSKVKRWLRMSTQNENEFRVIIVRKEKRKCPDCVKIGKPPILYFGLKKIICITCKGKGTEGKANK